MDGNENEYPDPTDTYRSPYPIASSSNYDIPSELSFRHDLQDTYLPLGPVVHEGFIPQPAQPFSMSDAAAQYRSIIQSFGLNKGQQAPDSNYPFNNGDAVQYDNGAELESEVEVEGNLMPNDFLSLGLRTDERDVDPDFALPDAEDQRSDDEMSLDDEFGEDALISGLGIETSARGRGSPRGRGRGRGRGGWKQLLKGTSHDPALEKASKGQGRGRGRGRGRPPLDGGRGGGGRRGKKKEFDPGAEFKKLQTQANNAFLNKDYENALEYARSAVQANPEIYAAHNLLSEILLAMGREQDSLAALLSGANTKRDPDTWLYIGDKTLELAGDTPTKADIEQAIYCYSQALKYNPEDYATRNLKMNLYLDLGNENKAKLDAKNMLRLRPDDMEVCDLYADLCERSHDFGEMQRSKVAYEEAIESSEDKETLGSADSQWLHLNRYLMVLDRVGKAREAVAQIKRLSRWFLGRKRETFWDRFTEDDREFDCDDQRRAEVPEFKNGMASPDKDRYGDGLPIEVRLRLGLFRLKMGPSYKQEAQSHLRHLLQLKDQVAENPALFSMAAGGLREAYLFEEAIEFYESMQAAPDSLDENYYMNLAACYAPLCRYDNAEICYKKIINQHPQHIHSRAKLAKLYDDLGRHEDARPLVNEVLRLGRQDVVRSERIQLRGAVRADNVFEDGQERDRQGSISGTPVNDGLWNASQEWVSRPQRPSPEASREERDKYLADQHGRILRNYELIKQLRSAVDAGHENAITQWIECARSMVGDFMTMKVFYPSRDKHIRFRGYRRRMQYGEKSFIDEMQAMKERLNAQQDVDEDDDDLRGAGYDGTVPVDFHDILFTEWHDIFIELGLHLAKRGFEEEGRRVLKAAEDGTVFYHERKLRMTSYAAQLYLALHFDDDELLCTVSRVFIHDYDYGDTLAGMPYQLFTALHRLHSGNGTWFNGGPTQKFMMRAVKAVDFHVMDPVHRLKIPFSDQEKSGFAKKGARLPGHVELEELDPGLLALYGHMMVDSSSYAHALNYYLRALTIQPENICLNLCIATSYVQWAMKRQTPNRQSQIGQGLAFIYRYYDLRRASGRAVDLQEAEYNVARLWHLLGLTHLAMPAYERALALSERVQFEQSQGDGKDREDFATEAAFALQGILALNGNEGAARALTEKYLTI